jgi:diguanylate cyclase (GGDEF)-like protein
LFAVATSPTADSGIVVLADRQGNIAELRGSVILVGLVGLILATGLGYVIARMIARPLHRLAAGARAVAAGDLDHRVEVGGDDDIARVGEAFNLMTENLKGYVSELKGRHEESRRILQRLGATLESTEDLDAMLGVILESAIATLGATSGAIYDVDPSGTEPELRVRVERGTAPSGSARLALARAVGHVARTGAATREPESAPLGPCRDCAIAAPLRRRGETMGVLALYGRSVPEDFAPEDLTTLASFAAQASVAIENVLLREEAERLSVTDSLTGIANRRFLESTLAREIERAQRFGRGLSVVMVDIDHFKAVNDSHGHRRGDLVLVETARRIGRAIRAQVDTFARYGGEEFVLVLPETPLEGALVAAEKMLRVLRALPFRDPDGGPNLWITASAGVASYPRDGATAGELLAAADSALYTAKKAGRDQVATGSPLSTLTPGTPG